MPQTKGKTASHIQSPLSIDLETFRFPSSVPECVPQCKFAGFLATLGLDYLEIKNIRTESSVQHYLDTYGACKTIAQSSKCGPFTC